MKWQFTKINDWRKLFNVQYAQFQVFGLDISWYRDRDKGGGGSSFDAHIALLGFHLYMEVYSVDPDHR